MATPQEIFAFAAQEAEKQGVPVDLVQRMIQQESGGNATARSPKGAYGPMQLMEGTAKDLGVNRNDPYDNVRGGVKYIGQLLSQFQDPRLAVAAYNAGPGAVQKYGDVPPFKETQNYVNKVVGMAEKTQDDWSPVAGIKGPVAGADEWSPVTGIGGIPTSQVKPQSFMGDVQTGITQAIKGGTPTSNAVMGGINILSSLINRGLTSAGMNVGPNSAQAELDRRAAESAAQPKRTIGETFSAIGDVAVNRPGLLLGSMVVPDPTSVFLPGRIAGATTQALKNAGTTARTAERVGQVAGAAGTGVTQAALNQVGAPNADQFMTEAGLSLATAPLAAIGGARTPKTTAALTAEQQALSDAVAQGLKVPPSQLTGGGRLTSTMETLLGTKPMAAQASQANREVVANQAKKVLGLAPDDDLTPDAFTNFRQIQGQAYQDLRNFDYKADKAFITNLNNEVQRLRALTTTTPEQISTLKAVAKTNIKGDDLVNNIIDLRDAGNTNMRSMDAANKRLGKTQLMAAKELEDVADRVLKNSGNDNLVKQFQDARKNIAKSYTLEDSFNAVTGEVNAKTIGRRMANGKIVPSEMQVSGAATQFAPGYFAPASQTGAASGLTGIEGLSAGTALLSGRPDLAAIVAARNVGRSAMLSGPMQRLMVPNAPIVGPMRPSQPNQVLPYMTTTPFQPVTQGLIDYMDKEGRFVVPVNGVGQRQ
jgi:hypothetical protein